MEPVTFQEERILDALVDAAEFGGKMVVETEARITTITMKP